MKKVMISLFAAVFAAVLAGCINNYQLPPCCCPCMQQKKCAPSPCPMMTGKCMMKKAGCPMKKECPKVHCKMKGKCPAAAPASPVTQPAAPASQAGNAGNSTGALLIETVTD